MIEEYYLRHRRGAGWISVAASMKRAAKVVEYVPAHCTQTGWRFVYWPPEP